MSTATLTSTGSGRRARRERRKSEAVPLRLYGVKRRTVNIVTVLCGLFAVFTLIPIWWIFVSSTKTVPNLNSSFAFWFARPFVLWDNLQHVFSNKEDGSFLQWMENTAIYAGVGSIGATLLSAMAGYGFARFNFRGRTALFLFVMSALLIPIAAFAVPLYLVYAKIHLDSTIPGIIIPFMISPVSVYLMRVYAGGSVPPELVDAARLDGAGEAKIFVRVGLPLMLPALVTVFLLNFVAAWNNYFLPFIINNSARLNTLTQGLALWMNHTNIAGGTEDYTALTITAGMLTITPLIILFLLLQRYWRSGLLLGSVTG